MNIMLRDTYGGQPVLFMPANPERVTMYVCGPTVYGEAHIGNARPAVVFDTMFRLLRRVYGDTSVVYARNYTDIDDKIMARAKETGSSIGYITETVIASYEGQMELLGVLEPTYTPKATRTIPEMISMIETLIEKGNAYVAHSHVFFDVSTHDQGGLSGQDMSALREAVRIDPSPFKRQPQDFVLWKPSVDDQPGWDSPWGWGRPGWHIECSAMIAKHLGVTIDIHGGGNDLMFPHHEAEIAQSECAHDAPLARHWMHNGMLTVDGRKMSKSAGNFVTIEDALNRAPGEAVRYALLGGYYRQPLDFSWDRLTESKTALDRIYRAMHALRDVEPGESQGLVLHALSDDLNTPGAISTMHQLASGALSGKLEAGPAERIKAELIEGGALLGLIQQTPEAWFHATPVDETLVESLIGQRNLHRHRKEFTEADAIRAQLTAIGVVLEDLPSGTVWRTA